MSEFVQNMQSGALNPNDTHIAYFVVRTTQDRQGFVGGLLVIDGKGIPQEFRCTLPMRPTLVQRTLYGDKLEPYIFIELMGAKLIEALDTRPFCCIVESADMLNLRQHCDIPIIRFEKSSRGSVSSADLRGDETHSMTPAGSNGDVNFEYHHDYPADYESVRGFLRYVSENIDLLEPFERVANSISMLSHNDDRFK